MLKGWLENKFSILYSRKIFFKNDGVNIFQDEQKLKQFSAR